MKKYFDVLGIPEDATQEEIREAYERLSIELDPEKNGNQEFFLEEHALIQEAYNVLTDKPKVFPDTSPQKNPIPSSNTSFKKLDFENKGTPNQRTKDFTIIIYLIIALIFVLIAVRNCNRNFDSDDSAVSDDTTSVTLDTAVATVDTAFVPPLDAIEFYETPENGFSPYDDYFGSGVYENGTNNEFVVKNSNKSDAIICLIDYSTDLKIRNEFIRKGSTFKLSNVPNGTYYLAWFSGNYWSPYKVMMGDVKGGFQTDADFSKSDGPSDLMDCDGGSQWTITLFTVENGNMQQKGMSEDEFFK